MNTSTNTLARLYGGGTSREDKDASGYKTREAADYARLRFEKTLRDIGRGIPRTELRKVNGLWSWNIVSI